MGKRLQSKYKINRRLGVNLWGRPKSPINKREYAPGQHGQRRGDTSENLVGILERRLDAVVYRMKFVPTVFASRQVISHGHIKVNGHRVNVASYMIKDGDIVELSPKIRDIPMVLDAVDSSERDVPDYIEVDHSKMRGAFIRQPELADIPYPVQMEPNLVIEFYSR